MESFKIKTGMYFGEGSLQYLKEIKYKKVFIVTDPFMVKSGAIDKVTELLQDVE